MSSEQKKRLKKVIKSVAVVVLMGSLYAIFVKVSGWALPCPIKLVTGYFCPGCGITRMCLALLRLDFEAAFYANRLLFFLLPVILFYSLIKTISFIKTGNEKQNLWEQIVTALVLLSAIAFWIMRNMEAFSFLAPIG